jgi:ADP-heptose:LPS heptosyltransferase
VKILLVQLKRIGDLILTTPAIRCLREVFPQAQITLLADSSCRGLLPALEVDECLVHEKRGGNAWIHRQLPFLRPDWCLDFSGTDRATFFCTLSRARRRVNFLRFRGKFLRRLLYSDFVDSSVRHRHTADHYTDLLQPLGIARENVPLSLRLPPADITASLLGSRGVANPYAVIHAGTARPEKYWLPERWAAIADSLREKNGLLPVFTGATAADELAHLSAIRAAMKGPSVDLTGATDLAGLAGVISGARIFCGVDTAAMHLADAVRTPTVALFGPTNPYQWRPRHTQAIVLRADTEEPFDVNQKGGPMEHISEERVTEALGTLLGSA